MKKSQSEECKSFAGCTLDDAFALDRAPTGQVDTDVLKKAFVVLDTVRQISAELATQTLAQDDASRVVREAHQANADALTQAQGLVQELAGEMGVSLPLNRGRNRG